MQNRTVAILLSLVLILGLAWAGNGTVTIQEQQGVRLRMEDRVIEPPPATPPPADEETDDILLKESFDGSWGPYGNNPPPGWTIIANGGDNIWNENDWNRYYWGGAQYYVAWIYWYPYDTGEDILMSPTINCGNYYNVILNCYTIASYFGGGYDWKIWGSTDGGSTWPYIIRDYGEASYTGYETFNLTWATGKPQVRIRWRGNGYIYNINWWCVDSVRVTADLMVAKDVAVTKIISPPAKSFWAWGDTLYPICEVTNYGTQASGPFPVRCRMRDTLLPGKPIAYDEWVTAPSLNPMQKCTVYFPPFLPPPLEEHFYIDTMRTELVGDQVPANNAMWMTHKITEWGSVWLYNHDGGFENAISWTSANGEWASRLHTPGMSSVTVKQVGVWVSAFGVYTWPAQMLIYGTEEGRDVRRPKSNPIASKDVTIESAVWTNLKRNVFDLECYVPDTPFVSSVKQLSVSPGYPYIGMDYNEPIDDNDAWLRHPSWTGNSWMTVRSYAGYHVDMSLEAGYAGRLIDGELAGFPFPDTLDSNTVVTFAVNVKNAGLVDRNNISFFACFIHDSGGVGYTPGETLYTFTGNTGSIKAGETKTITFTQTWTAKPGKYHFAGYTTLLYDKGYENDSCIQPLFIRYRDVKIEIVRPQPVEAPGLVPVSVRITNLGNVPAYVQRLDIQIGTTYAEYRTDIAPLPVGGKTIYTFPNWLAEHGIHNANSWLTWDLDMFPDNNSHGYPVVVGTPDFGVTAILSPAGMVDPYNPVTPRARIKNFGDVALDFTAFFNIYDMSAALVYQKSITGTLNPGVEQAFDFEDWLGPRALGPYTARCSVAILADVNPTNNVKQSGFLVAQQVWQPGWKQMKDIPNLVKDGSFLVHNPDNGLLYAARGYKSGDFYIFDPMVGDKGEWTIGAPWPTGQEGKGPAKGAVGCYGNGYVYATKGNNTAGFWRYSVADNKWDQLQDVPAGTSGKKVKGGTDMVYVVKNDTGFVYLLKGYKCDFMRFNTATGLWENLPDAPTGIKGKWDKGSWLAFDGDHTIYAHKAKYQEFYAYDINTNTWSSALSVGGIPVPSTRTGKQKKSGDGSAAAFYQGYIYALKGNNTCELWRFNTNTNSWYELPPMPDVGVSGARKRVKSGGDIVSYGGWAFFFLKGNKTAEVWRYVDSIPTVFASYQPERSGVMAERVDAHRFGFTLAPNPLVKGYGLLTYSVPQTGEAHLKVYDVTGRSVANFTFVASGTGTRSLDLRNLAAGVYLVKFEANGQSASQKLIVR